LNDLPIDDLGVIAAIAVGRDGPRDRSLTRSRFASSKPIRCADAAFPATKPRQ